MEISKATIDDLPDLVSMGEAFFDEAKWHSIYGEWDDTQASEALSDLINDDNAILFMARADGKSVGMIGGYLSPFWLKKTTRMITEFYWYVQPEYRGRVGILLKNALDSIAREEGAEVSQMSSLAEIPEVEALYGRMGYELREKIYIKRL